MARYDVLLKALNTYIVEHDNVIARGKAAAQSLIARFAEYLELPAGTAYCIEPGAGLDSPKIPMPRVGALQEDGWFAATIVVRENTPIGGLIGVTFRVLVEDGQFRVKSGDEIEIRVKDLETQTLEPFFHNLLDHLLRELNARPLNFSESARRPIGFVWQR